MRDLSALTHFTIKGCPILANTCKRGTGEDWNKIAHVRLLCLETEALDEKSGLSLPSKQLMKRMKKWKGRALSNSAHRSVE